MNKDNLARKLQEEAKWFREMADYWEGNGFPKKAKTLRLEAEKRELHLSWIKEKEA